MLKFCVRNRSTDRIQSVVIILVLKAKLLKFKILSIGDIGNQLLKPSGRYFLNDASNSVVVPRGLTMDFLPQKLAKVWRTRPRKQFEHQGVKNRK